MNNKSSGIQKLSVAGVIISLGIVYGDLGTSPLYVMSAILSTAGTISKELILGALSCIIWTLTLQTTLKYIIITLRADNKGEGGILSLFALIRRRVPWVFFVAMIGAGALLADGIITPSITVLSAVEGLTMISPDIPILPIVFVIITILFIVQSIGTNKIGKSFGPVMFLWFTTIGVLGAAQIVKFPWIIKAVNPYYAFNLLVEHPKGIFLLGAVFLCTTGAEALYLDLGHCGLKNIRMSWIYVKTCLILNYLGQGAWILLNIDSVKSGINPFYTIMPEWFLISGIILATVAAIIASQAIISGSYTIISEAILLNFWPKVKIKYPTIFKGQMYIPSINWFLYFACIFVISFFQKSSNMGAAYGLSINLDMLMTTTLMALHLFYNKKRPLLVVFVFLAGYLLVEGTFLISNLNKFVQGGWFTLLICSALVFIMFVWYNGRKIKNRYYKYLHFRDFIDVIRDLSKDESIPKYATNLVYITNSSFHNKIESKIIYSILNKRPKRADTYWFIHIDVVDEPYLLEYKVDTILPGIINWIDFKMGFKINPRINLYFREAVKQMVENGEVDITSRYASLMKHNVSGDFRFIIIDRIINYDYEFPPFERFIMNVYNLLRNIGISDFKAYGLDTSIVETETVPLVNEYPSDFKLNRIHHKQERDLENQA